MRVFRDYGSTWVVKQTLVWQFGNSFQTLDLIRVSNDAWCAVWCVYFSYTDYTDFVVVPTDQTFGEIENQIE